MKVSKETAACHRAALLAAAGRLFRERGFDNVGIAEIAAAAGLTHGAFYTHFESKDALCAEAVEAITRAAAEGLKAAPGLHAYVEAYLSPLHVFARGDGCPFAALCGDAVRQSPAIKASVARGVDRFIDALAEAVEDDGRSPSGRRAEAIQTLATLIGGMMLARTASDEQRHEILEALKASLL
jgi:TetR/AcrR family transcriptional regulator, transcriptional repressor for nem operon